jgi:hypothetical protein
MKEKFLFNCGRVERTRPSRRRLRTGQFYQALTLRRRRLTSTCSIYALCICTLPPNLRIQVFSSDSGFGIRRFGRAGALRLSASPCRAGYRRPIETTTEFVRIKL